MVGQVDAYRRGEELDEMVAGFRARPLDAGPHTFAWIDALTQKVCEGGRTVSVHALIATGVNAGGKREILGIDVASSEDGAGRLAFPRGLVARSLSGVQHLALKLGGSVAQHVRGSLGTSGKSRLAERTDHRTGELDVGGPRVGKQ